MNAKKKKKKPVSRKFWSFLRFLPKSWRAKLIQSKFDIELELPPELTFKQAETPEEIQQALNLVHDSYVELNYIDPHQTQIHFSKFHALPTTVILVAKWKDEVIGTISIIPDSFLGLPSDTTWTLDKFRKNGKVIAEISSLCIKKDFRMRRGRLLMPLFKAMHHYCAQILKLDGIVIATTVEVEPFYTEILQFEKVTEVTGQEHQLVKGNPSSCCYLSYQQDMEPTFRKAFAGKPKNRDIHHFLFVHNLPNIQLPKLKNCIQSYMTSQNSSLSQIFNRHDSLVSKLSELDRQIIQNLDVAGNMTIPRKEKYARPEGEFREPRFEVRFEGWCFIASESKPIRCRIMDISKHGFRIYLNQTDVVLGKGDHLHLCYKFRGQIIACQAEISWMRSDSKLGCSISRPSEDWKNIIEQMGLEIGTPSRRRHLSLQKTG